MTAWAATVQARGGQVEVRLTRYSEAVRMAPEVARTLAATLLVRCLYMPGEAGQLDDHLVADVRRRLFPAKEAEVRGQRASAERAGLDGKVYTKPGSSVARGAERKLKMLAVELKCLGMALACAGSAEMDQPECESIELTELEAVQMVQLLARRAEAGAELASRIRAARWGHPSYGGCDPEVIANTLTGRTQAEWERESAAEAAEAKE